VLLAIVLLAGGIGTVSAAGVPTMTQQGAVRILSPKSGADVGPGFLLSWTGESFPAYAVVVDRAVPAPGAVVAPSGSVLVVKDATALRLTLGPRSDGSPSARRQHTVVVVPLDAAGHRVGEQSAVVSVRSRA
jgi:hypothetical protein